MSEAETFARLELQRIATHVLAAARFAADGKFGLRVTPTGIATPAFGTDDTVLRLAGPTIVRESRGQDGTRSKSLGIAGRTLAELANFAGVDLDVSVNVGHDTPPLGEIDAVIELEPAAVEGLLSWFRVGTVALDLVLSRANDPSVIQLWPEHFDVALDVSTGSGRVNLGASPGDEYCADPYLYVAPWESDRPGDPSFWNAPFGAVLVRSQGVDPRNQIDAAVSFMESGLDLLTYPSNPI